MSGESFRGRDPVRAWICRRFGHRWIKGPYYAPTFYTCKRCHEPGFWVAT